LQLLHNEQLQTHALEGAKSPSREKVQGLDSGTPLIPSAAKVDHSDNSSSSFSRLKSSDSQQCDKPAVVSGDQSHRKRVWRCRKTNSAVGAARRSAGSKVNESVKLSAEQTDDCDTAAETQSARRSPRSVKYGSSMRHSNEVGKQDWLT